MRTRRSNSPTERGRCAIRIPEMRKIYPHQCAPGDSSRLLPTLIRSLWASRAPKHLVRVATVFLVVLIVEWAWIGGRDAEGEAHNRYGSSARGLGQVETSRHLDEMRALSVLSMRIAPMDYRGNGGGDIILGQGLHLVPRKGLRMFNNCCKAVQGFSGPRVCHATATPEMFQRSPTDRSSHTLRYLRSSWFVFVERRL